MWRVQAGGSPRAKSALPAPLFSSNVPWWREGAAPARFSAAIMISTSWIMYMTCSYHTIGIQPWVPNCSLIWPSIRNYMWSYGGMGFVFFTIWSPWFRSHEWDIYHHQPKEFLKDILDKPDYIVERRRTLRQRAGIRDKDRTDTCPPFSDEMWWTLAHKNIINTYVNSVDKMLLWLILVSSGYGILFGAC